MMLRPSGWRMEIRECIERADEDEDRKKTPDGHARSREERGWLKSAEKHAQANERTRESESQRKTEMRRRGGERMGTTEIQCCARIKTGLRRPRQIIDSGPDANI